MKKRMKWILAVCVVLALVVGGVIAYPHIFSEPAEIIDVKISPDYVYVTPDDLLEHSDLVVVGTYNGDEGCYANPATGFPRTYGSVTVDEIIKGSCESAITITFSGGEIPMKEHLEVLESITKDAGKDESMPGSTDKEVQNQVLRVAKSEESVNALDASNIFSI